MDEQTQPDVVLDACRLQTNFKNSGKHEIKYTNKVMAYLK